MAGRRHKGEERALALARIARLVELAGLRFAAAPHLSDRYAGMASRLATRYQTGLPAAVRDKVCRACHAYLPAGRRRVRLTGGKVVATCLACGDVRRRPLAPRPLKGGKGNAVAQARQGPSHPRRVPPASSG